MEHTLQPPDVRTREVIRRHLDKENEAPVKRPSLVLRTTDDLPSYSLQQTQAADSCGLAIYATRATLSYFSRTLPNSADDAPTETNPVRPSSRRSSVSVFRPLVAAATKSNLLSPKTDASTEQHFEAMVQRFLIRRLPSTLAQPTPGLEQFTDNANDVPKDCPAAEKASLSQCDPKRQSRSGSSLRHKSSIHAQTSTTEPPQLVADTLTGVRASRRARFSLSRLVKSWQRKLIANGWRAAVRLSEPMSPSSVACQARDILLIAAFTWYVTYIPLQLGFSLDDSSWRAYVEIPIEVLFIVDFLLGFNTSFIDSAGEVVTSRKAIAWNYLTGWCMPDLVSSIPVGTIAILRHGHLNSQVTLLSGGIRIQRLIHVMMVVLWSTRARFAMKGFSAWLLYSRYSHLVRIVWVLLGIFCVHCALDGLCLEAARSN